MKILNDVLGVLSGACYSRGHARIQGTVMRYGVFMLRDSRYFHFREKIEYNDDDETKCSPMMPVVELWGVTRLHRLQGLPLHSAPSHRRTTSTLDARSLLRCQRTSTASPSHQALGGGARGAHRLHPASSRVGVKLAVCRSVVSAASPERDVSSPDQARLVTTCLVRGLPMIPTRG